MARTSDKSTIEQETVEKCRNVLQTYAKRNPDIGYCQGMNFIVWALCRKKLTEEVIFKAFYNYYHY